MSQGFPSPSGQPGPPGYRYQGPQRDPAELARKASIILFILGGLIALLGVGNSTLAFTFSGEEISRQNQQLMPATQASGGFQVSPLQMKTMAAVAGVLELVIGVGLMLLGTPVRRGRPWAITTSLVSICIIGGFTALMLIGSLATSVVAPPMLAVSCMLVIPAILCGLLLKWLIQVIQASRLAQKPYPGPPTTGWPPPTAPPSWQRQPGPAPLPGSGTSPYVPPAPPAGERPVRYGYAQAPVVPEPPVGDAPVGSAPLSPPAPGLATPNTDESSPQG